jgi:predicted RNA-binding Zn ribbon-like protein
LTHFDFSSGELCLDFANTVSYRPSSSPEEKVRAPEDLVEWARQAGIFPADAPAQFDPRTLESARGLRETIYAVFADLAAGREQPAALDDLERALREELPNARLARHGGRFAWTWDGPAGSPEHIRWQVLQSAAQLLTSNRLSRVRVCGASDCGWLFIDTTRNRSRRWCDMKVCGNREKLRRFRSR